MRTLEELNLVDDFLVNSLTSHKIYGNSQRGIFWNAFCIDR